MPRCSASNLQFTTSKLSFENGRVFKISADASVQFDIQDHVLADIHPRGVAADLPGEIQREQSPSATACVEYSVSRLKNLPQAPFKVRCPRLKVSGTDGGRLQKALLRFGPFRLLADFDCRDPRNDHAVRNFFDDYRPCSNV